MHLRDGDNMKDINVTNKAEMCLRAEQEGADRLVYFHRGRYWICHVRASISIPLNAEIVYRTQPDEVKTHTYTSKHGHKRQSIVVKGRSMVNVSAIKVERTGGSSPGSFGGKIRRR